MTKRNVAALAALSICLMARGEEGLTLSPREVFYKVPVVKASVEAKPVDGKPVDTVKPATQATIASESKPRHQKPSPIRESRPSTPAVATVATTAELPTPLVVRYSLLRDSGTGQFEETDPVAIFRTGDRLRVQIQSNDAGYLYIFAKGTSDSWTVLYPNEQTSGNRIASGKEYVVPAKGSFTFDDQPGRERLYILLARQPEPDLERLIFKLGQQHSTPVGTPAPAAVVPAPVLTAKLDAASLESVMDRSRLVARDLIFETVDDSAPASPQGRREKAVYVENASGGPQARVLVDLKLEHR